MGITEWWNSLDSFMRVLYCIAIPASLILIVQMILTLVGFGDGGQGVNPSDVSGMDLDIDLDLDMPTDLDVDLGDGSVPSDFGALRLFTLEGIVAFLTVFSWMAIISYQSGLHGILAIFAGFIMGSVAMFGVAKIIQLTARLAGSGNISLKNALGKPARVYLPIAPSGKGAGKVNLTLQERFIEATAITDGDTELKVGTMVRVVDVRSDVLVVEKD